MLEKQIVYDILTPDNSLNSKPYEPDKIYNQITIADLNDNRIYKLLEGASVVLGKLDQMAYSSESVNMFTDMHVYLEAIESSEIEGTHAEPHEIMIKNTEIKDKDFSKKAKDARIIMNLYDLYSHTHHAKEYKEKDLFKTKNIEFMNKELFKGVKEKEKITGKIRKDQNYVGGTNAYDASYIPPVPEKVPELMEDLYNFWHNDFSLPNLIKIAIYHYQFETIHPFMDGNGRLGRLLSNLQLNECKILNLPILCLSNYWKKNRENYYNAISDSRYSHDLSHWVRFFLSSIYNASIERLKTIHEIDKTVEKYIKIIRKNAKVPQNYEKILKYLVSESPYISALNIKEKLNLSYQGANKIIEKFVRWNILKEYDKNQRTRYYVFDEYYKLMFNLVEM